MESTQTSSLWTRIWNERDVQIMVLFSLTLQVFLLFTGNVQRQRRVNAFLRFLVWLAYLASYAVAASAIGLFSQYEVKYKLRSLELLEHLHTLTLPFLWAPFLLLHLGGQDTITAFSMEDNNLWMRELINLLFQLSLALYVFWKSFDLLDWQLIAIAVPLFVAGIIKCWERIWALWRGSRNSLDCRTKKHVRVRLTRLLIPPDDVELASRALNLALSSRRLIAGRTMFQLGSGAVNELLSAFEETAPTERKLKIVLTELGMIYDMLYTKTMVLLTWRGGVLRCVALVAMVLAFVLFGVNHHLHAHKTTNAAITYMLFIVAILVEFYSIFMVIASPWTRARSKQGRFSMSSINFSKFLCWLSPKLASCFPSQGLPSPSMGQFNLTDYSLSKKSMSKFISEEWGQGLEKHWRNFWHVKHVEDKMIVNYIMGLLNTDQNRSGEQSRRLNLGQELKDVLSLPFEHTLFRLHIFTEMHLSTLDGDGSEEMKNLMAECKKLSNYLMYLMAIYPSMLPVGAAQDLESDFAEWVGDNINGDNLTKAHMLEKYAIDIMASSPFGEPPSRASLNEVWAVESLKDLKEVWARLLIYAAAKCPMEEHARQLRNGVELLTVVGTLMIHHCLGDVGLTKLELLAPEGFVSVLPEEARMSSHDSATPSMRGRREPIQPTSIQPLYAFEFDDNQMPMSVKPLLLPMLKLSALRDIPGLTAPTQFTWRRSTSNWSSTSRETDEARNPIPQGTDEAVVEIELEDINRWSASRSLSAGGIVRSPQEQLPRTSSI